MLWNTAGTGLAQNIKTMKFMVRPLVMNGLAEAAVFPVLHLTILPATDILTIQTNTTISLDSVYVIP